MTVGQSDSDPIPPHAITMWLSDNDIIAAMPMSKGGIPYLMKLPLNESGLMRALELLRKRRHEVLSPLEAAKDFGPPKVQPQVRLSKAQERLHSETTSEQRAAASDLLKRLGIVKP